MTEGFGDPAQPPVLLILGATVSMLWWPTGLFQRLPESGHFVMRYDSRNTGLSTACPPAAPHWALDDMAGDTIRVIDGYGRASAHLDGMSMGGMIAPPVHPSFHAPGPSVGSHDDGVKLS